MSDDITSEYRRLRSMLSENPLLLNRLRSAAKNIASFTLEQRLHETSPEMDEYQNAAFDVINYLKSKDKTVDHVTLVTFIPWLVKFPYEAEN